MKQSNQVNSSHKHDLKYHTKTLLRILIILLLFAMVAILLNKRMWSGCLNHQYDGTYDYAEPSWVYRQGDTVLESELTVPAFRHMEKGETYSISVPLSYDGSQDRAPSCFFFVDHMHCRVLLDGEEIFSYMPDDVEKTDRSKSPGNVYVSAELPSDCLGKELTIEFVPSLDADIEYQLPNPTFGDYTTQMADMFWEDLPLNLIATLTLFLGLSCIFYSTIAMADSNDWEGIFIGIFAILFGLYNVTESDFDFYMISNPYRTYVLDYITFTLIPIFFLAFLRERMTGKRRQFSLVLILISAVMFTVEMILHFTGIYDMREFLPIIHVVYFADVVLHLILIATMKKNQWRKPLTFQLIPILIGMLIDVMVYYMHWQLGSSDSTFTAIGVTIFLISELLYAWKRSTEIYTESTRSRIYQQMACVDSLTGIGNRRAFEMEKDSLQNRQKHYTTLTVISADLNTLKVTNDRFGHGAGDFLIRSVANVLTDLSADHGEAFRIGGDEFIAFLCDISEDELDRRLQLMYAQIDEINSNSNAKLDLAVGVQVSNGDLDLAIELADRNMYIDKAQRKAAMAREAAETPQG